MSPLVGVLVVLSQVSAAADSCALGRGHTVRLLEDVRPARVGSVWALEIDGVRSPALPVRGAETEALAEKSSSACVAGVYVVVFDTGSVNQPGVAVWLDEATRKPARLSFAQKGRPRFVQQQRGRVSIIFDSDGLRDDHAPYVRVSTGVPAATPLQRLPARGLTALPDPG